MAVPISHFSSQIWSNERWLKTFAQYFTLMSLHPLSRNTSSLLLLFSSRFCRFSSLSRASSSSCCWRHLWKFSTTTPTNMLSTKKLTMSRNEMKNSSIQGLWFLTGCREKQREKSEEERTGGSTETQKVKKKKTRTERVMKEGEEEKERAQTKRQCKYWVSTKTASSVSSHLFIHLPFFSFLCTATPHSRDISPFTLKQTRSSVPKNDTKKKEITGKYSLAEWVVHLPDFHFLIPHTPALPPLCARLPLLTCWSTPMASRPSYMMLTQPSLHDSTKSDISAWRDDTHIIQLCCYDYQPVRADVCPRVWQTCPRLSKLYFRRSQW